MRLSRELGTPEGAANECRYAIMDTERNAVTSGLASTSGGMRMLYRDQRDLAIVTLSVKNSAV